MKLFIKSLLIALLFQFITATIAFSGGSFWFGNLEFLYKACFYIQLIPFGLAFTGASIWQIIAFYFISTLAISVLILFVLKIIGTIKNKGNC